MDLTIANRVQEIFHIEIEEESLSHIFRHVSEVRKETKGGISTYTHMTQNVF